MKFSKILAIILAVCFLFCACKSEKKPDNNKKTDEITIVLSDKDIKVNDKKISTDKSSAVYKANDIVYYESGKDFTYGEGGEKDSHSKEEADKHTVVHITKPGTYNLSGKLSLGQIAVDLGENAFENRKMAVTLILNGLDITSTVAPAVIFYNVYECSLRDIDNPTKDVDTSEAGANVIIADGTKNKVNGAYVEKIYKVDTVVLNEEKTEVEDAEKLHKYDGAFYSKMTMNITGGKKGDGVLDITAANEGLDSELHLTINGGNINIRSGNDGINTNEDGVSVTTINGGNLNIKVTGETGEGDGIDSNGWLVINGGSVTAFACSDSADAGIDSDMGIHITGGQVLATGSMLDRIEAGGQAYTVFNLPQKQEANEISIKDKDNKEIIKLKTENKYSVLLFSSKDLNDEACYLFVNDEKIAESGHDMMGGMRPEGAAPPDMPEGSAPPEKPEGMEPPKNKPEGDSTEPPPKPDENGNPQKNPPWITLPQF